MNNPALSYGVRCNWGAIFCGTFMTLGTAALLLFLANTLGISPIHIIEVDAPSRLKTWSWIYTLFAWIVAFFVGWSLSSRVGAFERQRTRLLHAWVTWAVSGMLLVIVGIEDSLLFRILLTGDGPAAAHWLMFTAGALGFFGAAAGSAFGKPVSASAPKDRKPEDRMDEEPIKAA